jgi:hypothetical protein
MTYKDLLKLKKENLGIKKVSINNSGIIVQGVDDSNMLFSNESKDCNIEKAIVKFSKRQVENYKIT